MAKTNLMNQSMRNQEKEHETFIARMKTTIARQHCCTGRILILDDRRQGRNVSVDTTTLINRMRNAIHHHNKMKKQSDSSSEEVFVSEMLVRYHTRDEASTEKIQKNDKSKVKKPYLSVDTTQWDYDAHLNSPTGSCSFSTLYFCDDDNVTTTAIFEATPRADTRTNL